MQFFPMLLFFAAVALIVSGAIQGSLGHSRAADNNIQSAYNSTHLTHIQTADFGRFQYRDGEVTLFQNTLKPSDFFFTPFPYVEPNLTTCNDNEFSGHTELTLVVSLYTTNLRELIKQHIKSLNDICQTKHCGVSLLPMHSIRLIQKGHQQPDFRKKFTLNSEWQSNTQLRQMIEFIIYTSNMSICESLKNTITSRCHLSNFEVQYSLYGQQTTSRTLEVTTEHVTKTSMYNQIQSQFPSSDQQTVALTGNDYKNLLSEATDQVSMHLRIEEGFESMYDPIEIDRLLDRQLQYKQVQLANVGDKLWDELYWTPELTRPDRLSKVLNKVIQKDAVDSDKFRYNNSQQDAAFKQDLKLHERRKLDDYERHLAAKDKNSRHTDKVDLRFVYESGASFVDKASANMKVNADVNVFNEDTNKDNKSNTDVVHHMSDVQRSNNTYNEGKSGTIIILQRKDVEHLLRYVSEHVEIEGDIIKPKPIDVILVKFDKLKSVTKLFSNTVQVKTRLNVHALPIGCPYKYGHQSSATWLEDAYHRLSNDLNELHKNFTEKLKLIKASIVEGIVGEIKLYSSNTSSLPCSWIFCHGQALSRIEYQRLFSVIGESFGAGDGITTFNVPDFRDRFPLGRNPIRSHVDDWEKGGNKEQILTIDQMPTHHHSAGTLNTANAGTHTHGVNDSGHNHGGYTEQYTPNRYWLQSSQIYIHGYSFGTPRYGPHTGYDSIAHRHAIPMGKTGITLDNDGNHSHSIEGLTGSVGSGNSFSIMPPYQTIAYIIFTGASCA